MKTPLQILEWINKIENWVDFESPYLNVCDLEEFITGKDKFTKEELEKARNALIKQQQLKKAS